MTNSASGKSLSVGIVGLGWPAGRHIKGYRTRENVRVAAICDRLEERRRTYCEVNDLADVAEFSDYDEMLAEADIAAVSVCLPNFLHAPATLAALRAGKHVLSEKPPTMTLSEAKEVVAEVEKSGLTYMYIAQRRFAGEMKLARELIAAGRLGEVYHGEASVRRTSGIPIGTDGWFVDKSRSGGGAMIDCGVHMLDAVWFALGCPKPIAIQGALHSRFGHTVPEGVKYNVEDFGAGLIVFENGSTALVQVSWALQQKENEHYVKVYGTKAGLSVFPPELYHDSADGRCVTSLEAPRVESFFENVGHFVDVVRGEAEPLTTPRHALHLMEMLEGIYKSAIPGGGPA